jgi:hypothetical protein
MNARNFVDYTSDRSHCESRMREICTYGLTRRRARPVRPSLLYCFPFFLAFNSSGPFPSSTDLAGGDYGFAGLALPAASSRSSIICNCCFKAGSSDCRIICSSCFCIICCASGV